MVEPGEADLRIKLTAGKITVKNARGELLMEGTAKAGLWNGLWAQLRDRVDVRYRATAKDFAQVPTPARKYFS